MKRILRRIRFWYLRRFVFNGKVGVMGGNFGYWECGWRVGDILEPDPRTGRPEALVIETDGVTYAKCATRTQVSP